MATAPCEALARIMARRKRIRILTIFGTGDMEDYDDIDAPWKPYREEIQTVIIKDGVTSIGNRAFQNCSALTQVNIPGSVTSIGSSAFYETALYNNADNWTNNVLYIDNCLIDAKEELSGNYEIAAGTRVIADWAFVILELREITIPNTVTHIGELAFHFCALTEITIPNSVTYIGEDAFRGCNALTRVTLPNSITRTHTNKHTRRGDKHWRRSVPLLLRTYGNNHSQQRDKHWRICILQLHGSRAGDHR